MPESLGENLIWTPEIAAKNIAGRGLDTVMIHASTLPGHQTQAMYHKTILPEVLPSGIETRGDAIWGVDGSLREIIDRMKGALSHGKTPKGSVFMTEADWFFDKDPSNPACIRKFDSVMETITRTSGPFNGDIKERFFPVAIVDPRANSGRNRYGTTDDHRKDLLEELKKRNIFVVDTKSLDNPEVLTEVLQKFFNDLLNGTLKM